VEREPDDDRLASNAERELASRVVRLPDLVDALAGASSDRRETLAAELNELLTAMRAPVPDPAEAAVVLAALRSRKLHGAFDGKGRSCRKQAVDTVLAAGFPFALEVAPDDLEFARGHQSDTRQHATARRSEARRNLGGSLPILGACIASMFQLAHLADPGDATTPYRWLCALVGAGTIAASFAFMQGLFRSRARIYAASMVLAAVAQAVAAWKVGGGPLFAVGGVLLGLPFATGAQPPPKE